MNILHLGKGVAVFVGVGLGPLCAVYAVLLWGLLLNVMIMLPGPWQSTVEMMLIALGLLIIVVAGMFGTGHLCGKTERWLVRCAILYAAWVLLASPICFVVSASIAGVSMAAVDGGTSRAALLVQEIYFSFVLLAVGHVFIVPWVTAIGLIFRKRFSQNVD